MRSLLQAKSVFEPSIAQYYTSFQLLWLAINVEIKETVYVFSILFLGGFELE